MGRENSKESQEVMQGGNHADKKRDTQKHKTGKNKTGERKKKERETLNWGCVVKKRERERWGDHGGLKARVKRRLHNDRDCQ